MDAFTQLGGGPMMGIADALNRYSAYREQKAEESKAEGKKAKALRAALKAYLPADQSHTVDAMGLEDMEGLVQGTQMRAGQEHATMQNELLRQQIANQRQAIEQERALPAFVSEFSRQMEPTAGKEIDEDPNSFLAMSNLPGRTQPSKSVMEALSAAAAASPGAVTPHMLAYWLHYGQQRETPRLVEHTLGTGQTAVTYGNTLLAVHDNKLSPVNDADGNPVGYTVNGRFYTKAEIDAANLPPNAQLEPAKEKNTGKPIEGYLMYRDEKGRVRYLPKRAPSMWEQLQGFVAPGGAPSPGGIAGPPAALGTVNPSDPLGILGRQ